MAEHPRSPLRHSLPGEKAVELQEVNDRLQREIAETSPVAITVVSREGRITYANPCAEKLLGLTRDETAGCCYNAPEWRIEHCDGTPAPEEKLPFHRALDWAEPVLDVRRVVVWPDGRRLFLSINAAPLFDEAGRPHGIVATTADISEQMRAEEKLLESETRYRMLVENSLVGVVQLAADGRLVYANPAMLSMFEAESIEEIAGRPFRSLCASESRKAVDAELEKRSQGISSAYEVEIEGLRGGKRNVVMCGASLFSKAGELIGSIGSAMDTTERKQAEEKLRHMQVQLAHVARLSTVGELAAEIAHVLSQPLYAILNYAKASRNLLAVGESPDLEGLRDSNEKIERIATGASGICKRLRSFASRAESERSTCDIREIVMESLALVAFESRRDKVLLEPLLSPIPLIVMANRVEIQQALVNLLHNAFEAMEGVRGRVRRVTIRTTEVGKSVEIVVSDNGVGLPSNDHRNIFDAFVTTKRDAVGMGLAISLTIVESHGGRLWATSNPEGGASFHCALPLVQGDDSHGN
jgi:PAS domain S-box-containing protein